MQGKFNKSDSAGAGSFLVSASQQFTAEQITSSQLFQAVLTAVPSELSWAIAGFLLAMWLFPSSWSGDTPRWRQLWDYLNNTVVLEKITVFTPDPEGCLERNIRVRFRTLCDIRNARVTMVVTRRGVESKPSRGEPILLNTISDALKGASLDYLIGRIRTADSCDSLSYGWAPGHKDANKLGEVGDSMIEIEISGRYRPQIFRFKSQVLPKGVYFSSLDQDQSDMGNWI